MYKCKAGIMITLDQDLNKLRAQAFDRADWAEAVVRRYHKVITRLDDATVRTIRGLYAWMFVPTTLWPFNIQDVLADCLSALENGKRLNTRHKLIIEMLPEPPYESICAAVTGHEFQVQKGTYENLVKTQVKYDQNELAIRNDPELRRQWESIKAIFDVKTYCDHKGVIRRTMTAERNLRPSFSVDMKQPADAFHAAFDAFCLRWNLYPLGAKSYNKGKPIRIEEFEGERVWWGSESDGFSSRVGNERAWRVSIDQIKAINFNLDLKNPHSSDEDPGDADHLLPEYEHLLAQIAATRIALAKEFQRDLQNRRIPVETLFEKSELFADAPNTVAKMRGLVLQLAVQGKLVPQDPNDEPAEDLIRRVSAALPNKPSENPFIGEIEPSITDESKYDLPPGWSWLPLGHIGIWATGCGFPKQYQGEVEGEFLFCKVSDMNLPGNEVEIRTTVNSIDAEVMKQIRARANPAGTVIFPKIGGAIATHKRRLVIKPTIIDNNCSGIQPIGLTDDRWLFRFMRSLDLTKYQSGTSVPAVSQGSLDPIRIGLPPLAEQRRIAAKVDQLMALVDQLETQLADSRATAANLLSALVAELTT